MEVLVMKVKIEKISGKNITCYAKVEKGKYNKLQLPANEDTIDDCINHLGKWVDVQITHGRITKVQPEG